MQHPYVPFTPPVKHEYLGGADIEIQGMEDETVCFICKNTKAAHSADNLMGSLATPKQATFGKMTTMK